MIPLCVPNLVGNEAKYLQDCIDTTFVSSVGAYVNEFERIVARRSGSNCGIATSSGTTALHAALTAIGVKTGDLVIAPSFTFIASCNAISHCGATPWLVDVSTESWTMDPGLLEHLLTKDTILRQSGRYHAQTGQRVSAILPVYALGVPADMDKICQLSANFGIPVIADAAAALGATYKSRELGTLPVNASCFSFNGNKIATAGGGGVIVGNNGAFFDHIKHLTTTAKVGPDYDHDIVGFNYRLTNLQAAVGCAQMENLDNFLDAKRNIVEEYHSAFSAIKMLQPFPQPDWSIGSNWLAGMICSVPEPSVMTHIHEQLREAGIEARAFWKPMHLQKPYQNVPRSTMDVSDSIWQRILILPCSTHLSEFDRDHVVDSVRKIFKYL